MAKRVHRYSHAPLTDMVDMLMRTECMKQMADGISNNIMKCSGLFLVCTASIQAKVVVQSHTGSVQFRNTADFMIVTIRLDKYCVLHAIDMGTGFSKSEIVKLRSTKSMFFTSEKIWINRNKAPRFFPAESEFTETPLEIFLETHRITLKYWPGRHNKTGIIARKNRTGKENLERL